MYKILNPQSKVLCGNLKGDPKPKQRESYKHIASLKNFIKQNVCIIMYLILLTSILWLTAIG